MKAKSVIQSHHVFSPKPNMTLTKKEKMGYFLDDNAFYFWCNIFHIKLYFGVKQYPQHHRLYTPYWHTLYKITHQMYACGSASYYTQNLMHIMSRIQKIYGIQFFCILHTLTHTNILAYTHRTTIQINKSLIIWKWWRMYIFEQKMNLRRSYHF